jgi:hypothetical protein
MKALQGRIYYVSKVNTCMHAYSHIGETPGAQGYSFKYVYIYTVETACMHMDLVKNSYIGNEI